MAHATSYKPITNMFSSNSLNSPLKGNRLITVHVNALNLNLSLKNHPPFSRESKHLICKYRFNVMNNVTHEMQNIFA
jgi:hypothetical protein